MESLCGEVEPDESCFGGNRMRGKLEKGVAGKRPVFEILKWDSKVLVSFVKKCIKNSLMPIGKTV